MTTEQTWEISDLDGGNRRRVTLAQFRAEVDAAKKRAMAIYEDAKNSLREVQP